MGDRACTVYCREPLPHFVGPDLELTRQPPESAEKHFPLLTRGWMYQERLLSPRILHFGVQELVWECTEEYACECQYWPSNEPDCWKIKYGLALKKPSHREFVRTWKNMVAEYTTLNLSFSFDRLPAMAGIAKHLESSIKSSYRAGLWQDSMIENLLWMAAVDQPIRGRAASRDSTQRMPS